MRTLSTALGVLKETPPQMMTDQRGPRTLARLSEGQYQAVVVLLHWVYGAAGGAAFGALPNRLRRLPWAGPAYGIGLWLGFEAVLESAFGIRVLRQRSAPERAALAADHLLYGAVLSEMRRRPAQ